MKRRLLSAFTLLALGLVGCTQAPSDQEQLQQFMQKLEASGHQIDKVAETVRSRPRSAGEEVGEQLTLRPNANTTHISHPEAPRRVRVLQLSVVVVAEGTNCKFTLRLIPSVSDTFFVDSIAFWSGTRRTINLDNPSPKMLKDYLEKHKDKFSFCIDQPYEPSGHGLRR